MMITHSVNETIAAAQAFAAQLQRGDAVMLFGELGSGKTQFVKGVCHAFHVRTEATSPSFVLLNRYEGSDQSGKELLLYHFDLYRVTALSEIYDLGYEEFLQSDGICFVEWAESLNDLLPPRRYDIHFQYGEEETERRIEILPVGEH
ncbi:MAG TPA: tRNA (adenosine(37)-N6)-threonylcarbamoyltransferase complex ATPase subunit type 1 TsaE [Bacteroidota bacterium]|nr:tRNA (adenosine(37)-N6)-threonylcarbamoyltransferase complex ATPase subunit type 1 TsaE [Bacteroidota bacterium]